MMNKIDRVVKNLFAVALTLSLAACNFPLLGPAVTPTATFTNTPTALPATDTPLATETLPPPSETPLTLPTDTATLPPPTATIMLPTLALPTAIPTNTAVPTQKIVRPESKARFEGTFADGTLVLRISENSNMIIPKLVRVRGATCKEGKAISDTVTFDPPPTYSITNAKFDINYFDYVFITGQFFSSTSAQGMIRLILRADGARCTIGWTAWSAVAVFP